MHDFPHVRNAIQQGIDRGLHTAVQIYVSLDGTPILNGGWGEIAAGRVADADSIFLWRSAGKPLTVAAILKRCEEGALDPGDRLGERLSVTCSPVLADVTLQQLMTHSVGLPLIDTGWPESSWDETLRRVCNISQRSADGAYQPQATWFLLGAVLEFVDRQKRRFPEILQDDVVRPLGMSDVWCGLPETLLNPPDIRLPAYSVRERGQLADSDYGGGLHATRPSPGGNLRGPVSALGTFYEMLCRRGQTASGQQLLTADSVTQMTRRHRAGKYDATFEHIVDFGFGVMLDARMYGSDMVPYGFGRHCSSETFGHGGAQCAMGFCDPRHRLVVAWAANGFCGEGRHQHRNRAINEAVYEDLGLC